MDISCKTCKFGGNSQQCYRHSPTCGENAKAIFPGVVNNWSTWCGDYQKFENELDDDVKMIENFFCEENPPVEILEAWKRLKQKL